LILHRQNPEVDYIASQECCIVAVTGLVHLDAIENGQAPGSSQRRLIQALYLLDTLFRFIKADKENIPDNRHAKLILGILALRLGLGTFAIGVFPEVKIKDALSDSLSHYLFTRISTLHPFPAGNQWGPRNLKWDVLDPTKLLTSAINMYASASARLRPYEYDDRPNARTMMTVQYDSLLEMSAYTHSLRTSVSRVQWTLERRRIRRLRGIPTKHLDEAEELSPDFLNTLSDNRSIKTLPNHEPENAKSFTGYLLASPQPGAAWIAATLLAEETHALLFGEVSKQPVDSRLRFFHDARAHLASVSADALAAELTGPEQAVLPLWRQLRPLALRLVQPEDPDALPPAEANAALKKLAAWMTSQQDTLRALHTTESDGKGVILPDRSALQTFYLTLEALRAIQGAVDQAESIVKKGKNTNPLKGVLNAAAVGEAKTALGKTVEVLRDQATTWRGKLVMAGEERIRKAVGEGKAGDPLAAVGGDLRAFGETVKAAALDALAAVLSVKMP
jgi:N-terminal acetyltransferase B complex non-catalytic subunit